MTMNDREIQMGPPNEDAVRDALRKVVDPEVGVNIVDLGLIYGITIGESGIQVDITMTSQACPMGAMLADEAHEAIRAAVPESVTVEVRLVWDPPWEPSMMSDRAKATLGW